MELVGTAPLEILTKPINAGLMLCNNLFVLTRKAGFFLVQTHIWLRNFVCTQKIKTNRCVVARAAIAAVKGSELREVRDPTGQKHK